jgi:RNA polymerase sigma factor (sigma-70 family)
VATGQFSDAVQGLRAAALRSACAGVTDSELLERFIIGRDEAAFEALVRRHGPVVLGVCRRALQNEADAEDAFQATWLVLVRKAASVTPRGAVGSWLYGVAYHTALKARAAASRRRAKEGALAAMPRPESPVEAWQDLHALLDQELSRLPDKHRAPLVLCELEGKTRKEAARLLGWAEGTVASRLARARALLARRMARHGLTLPLGALLTALFPKAATAGTPAPLVVSTIKAATLVAAGQATTTAKVAALMKGAFTAMSPTRIKIASAALLATALLGLWAGAFGVASPSAEQGQAPAGPPAAANARPEGPEPPGPPPILGQIKHRAVAELPLPRDRTTFGIGEEVEYWIEKDKGLRDPAAVVTWRAEGMCTVYPVVGTATIVTVDVAEKGGTFETEPTRRDRGGVPLGRPSARAGDLRKWLREQAATLPKRKDRPSKWPPPEVEYRKVLHADLSGKLDALRNGEVRPAKIDEQGRALLTKYPGPKERGQVYYHLAHIHAQTGLRRPARVVEYAKKALEHPLGPSQRARLYVYWGDAVQVARANDPLAERRKWAALPYLAGLKELLALKLPDKAPPLPDFPPVELARGEADPQAEQLRKQRESARRLATFQGEMIKHRDVLTRQIVAMYGRGPSAEAELGELAGRVLQERRAVDRLMAAVKGGKGN